MNKLILPNEQLVSLTSAPSIRLILFTLAIAEDSAIFFSITSARGVVRMRIKIIAPAIMVDKIDIR